MAGLPAGMGFSTVHPDNTTMYKVPEEKRPNGDENKKWRWNLLWLVIFSIVLVPLPLWLFVLDCMVGQISVMVVSGWGLAVLLYCAVNNVVSMLRMYRLQDATWKEKYPEGGKDKIHHLVAMAGYKEPLDLMCLTVDSVAKQTVADRIVMVVGLEEGTPDFDDKKEKLEKQYQGKFKHFMVTRHPRGWLTGEIPGKCSNINYAMRKGLDCCIKDLGLDINYLTSTTCDTDNIYPEKYFEYLGFEFLTRSDRYEVVWQAPLFYNLGLDERPWFVRNTGLLRSFYMTGFLIAQNINTMSVYSVSAILLVKGKFYHHRYQMDDIIYTLTCMIAIQKRVVIREIPYPMVSGPTSGDGYWGELKEWALQARRWAVGAAEVFHYFCVKFREFDFWSGLGYGFSFSHYYGFVLGAMGMYVVTGTIALLVFGNLPESTGLQCGVHNGIEGWLVSAILLGMLVGNYAVFALVVIIDALAVRLLEIDEKISLLRKVFHWAMTLPTILMYNMVQYFGMWDIALRGKTACNHKPSKKSNLVEGDVENPSPAVAVPGSPTAPHPVVNPIDTHFGGQS